MTREEQTSRRNEEGRRKRRKIFWPADNVEETRQDEPQVGQGLNRRV